jgi:hypothetical protein
MTDQGKRLEEIYNSYISKNKERFDALNMRNNDIFDRLKQLRGNVFNHIQSSCQKQFKWLEIHGDITYDDEGIHVELIDNPGNVGDAIIREFDSCAQSNDFGLKSFFDKENSKRSLIFSMNQTCLSRCTHLAEDKSNDDIFRCFDSCFKTSLSEADVIMDEVDEKIKNLKKNFM